MQNATGCKINVTPASGRDIEREIGLIGSRDSIEGAKNAIWEKVRSVVRQTLTSDTSRAKFLCSKRRTAPVLPFSRPRHYQVNKHSRRTTNLKTQMLIRMPNTVDIRTISPCGILAFKQIKVNQKLRPKVPRACDLDDVMLRLIGYEE